MKLVSACLCGIDCKYNGENNYDSRFEEMLKSGNAVPVCPEQLGGFTTPRPPVEISGGTGGDVLDGKAKAIRKNGEDVSEQFVKGAQEVLKIARLIGADTAILKAKSPSCGCGKIYDGTFSGSVIVGNGVVAELLIRNGIKVFTEEDF